MSPRLLDLFCGAGGAAMGYHRAGFEVVGVDIAEQPHYPFAWTTGGALEAVDELLDGDLEDGRYDAIHASPPCQRWSMYSRNLGTWESFPDLITPLRPLLLETGLPFVIENVDGAPLQEAIRLCGASFGLGTDEMYLRRHRRFELRGFSVGMVPPCACGQKRASIGVYGNGTPSWHRKKIGRNVLADEWREAMGIDWMVKSELKEAIPPAYTEHIGHYLMAEVKRRQEPAA